MGGAYGTGKRIDLPSTRKIINSILDDSILNCDFKTIPVFNLIIPTDLKGLDNNILDPSKVWSTPEKWHLATRDLAIKFINNFSKFTSNEDTATLVEHGPVIE